MAGLTLREHDEGDVCVLVVLGELDVCSGPYLDDYLIDLAALGRNRVVLDAFGLTFCDAAGIRIMLRGEARARTREGWLRLAGADWRVRRVLAIVKLTKVLPVFDSVGDAVAGVAAMPATLETRPARSPGLVTADREALPGRSGVRLPG